MLFHDDVVTDREPEPGALSGSFCREEWIELPCPHLLNAERRRLAVLVQFPLLPPPGAGDTPDCGTTYPCLQSEDTAASTLR
jgi:hypothetical protein